MAAVLMTSPDSTAEMSASVVIPAYNHESHVLEAVDSALSEPVLEVVVVDDGSTDATRERLTQRALEPRLRVLTQENRGAHAALARGIEAACGDVVFILNSDDVFVAGRVARCLALLGQPEPPAAVASWLELIDGQGTSLGVKQGWHTMPPWPLRGPGPSLAATGDPVLALLEANYVATSSNIAFARGLMKGPDTVSFAPLRYAHDWDFLLSACSHGGLAIIEEPLVRYRIHGTNTIREGKDDRAAEGLMRFEILWVIARHRHVLLQAAAHRGQDRHDLETRAQASLPPFATDALVTQLLAIRGSSARPPTAYDALIAPGHPFRAEAIAALSGDG